ncbi:MAG TPA: hypothetical protein PLT20_08985 [Sedimentisphaerales bacterium]|nr:hypothetical protein [Sedimentisphaerales bacterium]HQI28209.1 hypothetical protein [Sedimentisphaerales bacterium]
MRIRCFALVFLLVGSLFSPPREVVPSESAIARALESGCSFLLTRIEAVHADEGRCRILARVLRTFVAGDLAKEETGRALEILGGAEDGDMLKVGVCYGMFVRQDAPYGFSWLFREDTFEINPVDQETLQRLHEVADHVYVRTAILRFRRGKVLVGDNLPDLGEDLVSLCKQFKDQPSRRSELGRRIAESDLGSRIDDSKSESAIRMYLPPRVPVNRGQMITLLGYPSWTCGWTCLWCCDERAYSDRGRGEMGVLSATFDPNERAVRVVYEMQERSKWIGSGRPFEHLAGIEGNPLNVARSFQEALRQSDWQKALSFCSPRVKADGITPESAAASFKRFVPVEQIVALREFRPGGFGSRDESVTEISMRVRIPLPGGQWSVDWPWTLVKVEQKWFVDFVPVALDIFVRKEALKREFMERPIKMNAGEFARAVEFLLHPIDYEFAIGAPMRFRVEMRNVSDDPIPYRWSSGIMVNDPMLVIDPNGEPVPYVDTSYQIGVAMDVALPGETIVLAESYDVATQYRIVRPGRYRFQFRGWPPDSESSNICEMEVKPGLLSDAERVSERLLGVMPTGWRFERMLSTPHGEPDAPGVGGRFFNLIAWHQGKGGDKGVFLVLFKEVEPPDVDPWLKEQYDLWGLCRWGLVYARTNEAAQLWPSHRQQIERALGIRQLPSR